MSKMKDKTVVVVGGSGGIGGAITKRFASEGAYVYATSRTADGSVSPEGDGIIERVAADAASQEDLVKLFSRVKLAREGIDSVVFNAGMANYAAIGNLTEELFDRTFELNVRSMVFAVQAAVNLMKPGGSVVLVGSIADEVGTKGYGVYGASKAAVRSFARTWANELAPRGIRVNVVSPGPTDTAMFEKASDELRKAVIGLIPLGRLGRPEEVASAALFLASDESSFTTGSQLHVDGGAAQV